MFTELGEENNGTNKSGVQTLNFNNFINVFLFKHVGNDDAGEVPSGRDG